MRKFKLLILVFCLATLMNTQKTYAFSFGDYIPFDIGAFFRSYFEKPNNTGNNSVSTLLEQVKFGGNTSNGGTNQPLNTLTPTTQPLPKSTPISNPVTTEDKTNNSGLGSCTEAIIKNGDCTQKIAQVPDTVYESSPAYGQLIQQQQIANQKTAAEANPFLAPDNSANTNTQVSAQGNNTGFVCKKNNGGSLTGGGSDCNPESQGGKIKDELYNAVKNAAEVSGVKVELISCFREGAKIAGTDKTSKHASGEALDLKPDNSAPEDKKANFILAVLANTDKYNSIGSYGGDMTHTHIGADKNALWTSFLTGTDKPEQYKIDAFLAAGVQHTDKSKTKVEVSQMAKKILPQKLGANCN